MRLERKLSEKQLNWHSCAKQTCGNTSLIGSSSVIRIVKQLEKKPHNHLWWFRFWLWSRDSCSDGSSSRRYVSFLHHSLSLHFIFLSMFSWYLSEVLELWSFVPKDKQLAISTVHARAQVGPSLGGCLSMSCSSETSLCYFGIYTVSPSPPPKKRKTAVKSLQILLPGLLCLFKKKVFLKKRPPSMQVPAFRI